MTEFSRLYRYDKKKREEKYNSVVHNFFETTKILFDVFQKEKNLRSEIEKNTFLKWQKLIISIIKINVQPEMVTAH